MRRVVVSLVCLLSLIGMLYGLVQAQDFPPRPKVPTLHSAVSAASANGTVMQVAGYGSVTVQWTSTGTWNGTLNFEYTVDGTNFLAVACRSMASATTFATTATATSGGYTCPVAGAVGFRARISGRTQGAVTVTAGQVGLSSSIGGGGGSGTVTGGACTNQVTVALDSSAVPTCTTVSSSYVNNTIALTGTDINTANQVTVTHLAAALPVTQGGLGVATVATDKVVFGAGTSPVVTDTMWYRATGVDPSVVTPSGITVTTFNVDGYHRGALTETSNAAAGWPKILSTFTLNPSGNGWLSRTNLKLQTVTSVANATDSGAGGGIGAIDITTKHQGTGTITTVGGLNAYVSNVSTGTVTLANSFDALVENTAAGTITTSLGLWSHTNITAGTVGLHDAVAIDLLSTFSGGTITERNAIHLYAPPGSATTDRAIYSQSTKPSLLLGDWRLSSTTATALSVSRNADGTTAPAFVVNASAANNDGVQITNSVAANIPGLQAIGGTDVPLIIAAKGTGSITLGTTTGAVGVTINATERGNFPAAGGFRIGPSALTLTAGVLGMPKITASGSAPGAAGLKLEVVCGTNAGSLKITALGGTSTTPATVLDNIGSGATGC